MALNWIDVTSEADLAPGEFEVLELDECVLALFNLDGMYYAIEDICTHDNEELTGGPIDGDQIICPRHGARFCIRTGKALTAPAYEPVATFPTRVHNGMIQVQVDTD
ncbi:MAG: non-heme iron oxygenase ferredoxin subunit [Chromatiales bacterium]|nr:non-heme iron oxygenase ferredoxin subunit [Chromatiales bacterium]